MNTVLADLSDDELLLCLPDNNEAAFTEIYNRYWKKLYFVAYKQLKSQQESEEIVQEVFLALWQKRQTLQIQSLLVYLAAMTRYAVYQLAAKKLPIPLTNKSTELVMGGELQLENKFLIETISKLANTLPERCRLVFIYNKLLDLPLAEVAQRLNISIKTAEAHLSKALKSVRAKLGDALTALLF